MTTSLVTPVIPSEIESEFHSVVEPVPSTTKVPALNLAGSADEVAHFEVLFGLLLTGGWIALFVFGSTVEPAVYRDQLRVPNPAAGLLGFASAMLGVALSYTPANVCCVSIVSAMLGCFGRRMIDRQRVCGPAGKDPVLGGHHTAQYGFAVISGFVLYLTLMGGILIITSEHASSLFDDDAGSTSQYVRVATLCALFATFFGYFPERMQMLFDQIQARMPFPTSSPLDRDAAGSSRPSTNGHADHHDRGLGNGDGKEAADQRPVPPKG